MCGFAGIINIKNGKHIDSGILKQMTDALSHRGPDDEGYFIENNIGFGFRRLSIIDLENGKQPMSDINGRAWIVFNGEIYNYREIHKDLIMKGYDFRTNSDTEVIINSYLEYGEKCVDHLRGMFAFVIWDKTHNKIFMARDRFGIKPLYYLQHSNGIAFASELKALLKSGLSDKNINIKAIDSFFTYGYILSPYSIYSDIHKLPAAHVLSIHIKTPKKLVESKRYWHPTFIADPHTSFEEFKIQIKEMLKESVQKHLVSDVPVGAFLSGGIDSNSVVSYMSELYGSTLKTFTIGFRENKFNETKLAKLTSKKYGTEHFQLIIDKKSALNLEKIIAMYDEPFGDTSAIPTYFVSKLASEHVKVVLSGDGGDELFGGYNAYKRLNKINKYKIPYFVRFPLFRTLSKVLPERLPGKRISYTLSKRSEYSYAYFNHIWYDEQSKLYNDNVLELIRKDPIQKLKINYLKDSLSTEYLSKMMELDVLTYLTDDILTKVDRASMANSLEVRVPIIDHIFFELAGKISSQYKINGDTGKFIFREAMSDYLPKEIYSFRKQGFTIPINSWFKDDLNDFMHDSINTGTMLAEFIKPSYLLKLKNTSNLGSLITRIWPVIVFNNWLNTIHAS